MMRTLTYLLVLVACNLSAGQPISSSSMLEDFDALRSAIEEAHGGLYRHVDQGTIKKHFDYQRAKLNAPLTNNEFIAVISETLAGLHDGHMRLELDNKTTTAIASAKMFPLRLAIEDSKLIVVFNDTKSDNALKAGTEIVSINNQTSKDLVARILPKVSGDGFIQTGKQYLIARNFALYYWLFIDQQSDFTIEARDATGRNFQAKLGGITNSERLNNRNANPVNRDALKNIPASRRKNILLQFSASKEIATISIGEFGGSDFKEELDSIFLAIQNTRSKAVILDLRGNGGGVDSYGAYLVSQFTDQSFRYFDHIHLRDIDPSFTTFTAQTNADLRAGTVVDPKGGFLVTPRLHPGVGVQAAGKYPFKGKLIVLMNGGTFSTAADVTATLHNMKRGIFIGEESGGGYEGNTSGTNARITLPTSRLSVRVQMYDYWNAVTVKEKGRGTLPDFPISNKVTDVTRGVDRQMNEAIIQAGRTD